ncbi:hypothetical protein AnigIFM62618_008404 [Aspergillus niger]|nr:hypothetical protein AnigIFM62618_008404 [Aspergillus niger]
MDATTSPLQRAFNAFLLTMPPQQLEELLRYLQDTQAKANTQVAHENEQSTARSKPPLDTNNESAVQGSTNQRSHQTRGKRPQDGKRRPLNSFIAFRSYYSVMFPDLTQKAKSGILRFLWQNDPFKAKWAIVAKAYSIIRDDHDNGVSLETFLKLNANLIGIIEPDRYLDIMGWELNVDGQQQYTMAKVKITATPEAELSTNYSVDDIVKNCYDTGYVSRDKCKKKTDHNKNAPVMAFAAQPTLIIHENNSIQINGNNTVVTGDCDGNAAVESTIPQNFSPSPGDMGTMLAEASLGESEVLHGRGYQLYERGPIVANEYEIDDGMLNLWGENPAMLPSYVSAGQCTLPPHDPCVPDPMANINIDHYLNL